MKTVFFSYTRRDPEDAAVLDLVHTSLRDEGFTVFRDVEDILPGDLWQHRIGRALEECGCGVALWTPSAATSEIMLAETAYLVRENRYVPICLGNSNVVPIVYRGFQYALLRDFDGDRSNVEWRKLVAAIRHKLAVGAAPAPARSFAIALRASGLSVDDIERIDPKTRDEPSQQTFQEGEGFPVMSRVGPGAFRMGTEDADGRANEQPRVAVNLEHMYAMSVLPVSFYEWNLAATSGALEVTERDPGALQPSAPVVGVSWVDAQRYIAWLNSRVGVLDAYRMPTESEWEFWATRADESSRAGVWSARLLGRTVWEWCEDTYFPSHADALPTGEARKIQGNPYKTVRGGSWRTPPAMVSPCARSGFDQSFARDDIGLRLVRTFE